MWKVFYYLQFFLLFLFVLFFISFAHSMWGDFLPHLSFISLSLSVSLFTKISHLYIARHEQERKPYDGEHERINPSDNVRERRTEIKGKSRTHIRRKERKNPYIGGQKRQRKHKTRRKGKRTKRKRERAHLPWYEQEGHFLWLHPKDMQVITLVIVPKILWHGTHRKKTRIFNVNVSWIVRHFQLLLLFSRISNFIEISSSFVYWILFIITSIAVYVETSDFVLSIKLMLLNVIVIFPRLRGLEFLITNNSFAYLSLCLSETVSKNYYLSYWKTVVFSNFVMHMHK